MLYRIGFILVWPFVKLLFPTKVIGKKNMPKDNFVGVCNHYSNLDVVLLAVNVKRFYYLGKKELFSTKFKSWFFKKAGVFPVDRDKPDMSSIKFALKTISSGKNFMVFPEGTRNKSEDLEHLQQVKQGAIMFASKTGKQIVPMIFDRPPKLFRRTKIIIGEPISIKGQVPTKLTKEEMDENTQILVKKMEDLRLVLNKNKK